VDPLGNAVHYDYDSRNRISEIGLPMSDVELTYDLSGNVTRRMYSSTLPRIYSPLDTVIALRESIRLMAAIDLTGEAHRGWELASNSHYGAARF